MTAASLGALHVHPAQQPPPLLLARAEGVQPSDDRRLTWHL